MFNLSDIGKSQGKPDDFPRIVVHSTFKTSAGLIFTTFTVWAVIISKAIPMAQTIPTFRKALAARGLEAPQAVPDNEVGEWQAKHAAIITSRKNPFA